MSSKKRLLLIFALLVMVSPGAAVERPSYNVVLITLDTLRPDHLGCYGYALIQTPHIDQLAGSGARFS